MRPKALFSGCIVQNMIRITQREKSRSPYIGEMPRQETIEASLGTIRNRY